MRVQYPLTAIILWSSLSRNEGTCVNYKFTTSVCKLFVLDRNTWYQITGRKNIEKLHKKYKSKRTIYA